MTTYGLGRTKRFEVSPNPQKKKTNRPVPLFYCRILKYVSLKIKKKRAVSSRENNVRTNAFLKTNAEIFHDILLRENRANNLPYSGL